LNWALDNIAGVTGGGNQPYRTANTGATGASVQQKPEDILKNFNDLKGLIIKSADIVNAYYEEINTKLSGLYVAQSEYGTFVEQTNAVITQNSIDITQNYSNLLLVTGSLEGSINSTTETLEGKIKTAKETLEGSISDTKDTLDTSIAEAKSDLQGNISDTEKNLNKGIEDAKSDLSADIGKARGELASSIDDAKKDLNKSIEDAEKKLQDAIDSVSAILVEVQAYVKSGLLYYDDNGIPIYGVEVGQTNLVNGQEVFNKYARFTSDRLSFFDQNGTEVAYISDRKLFISNVEITVSLKMGGFEDTVMADKSIITKWVGGAG
jgi:vacuolar-type H+-ATPase subunit H